jgi:nitronate monooxygenase
MSKWTETEITRLFNIPNPIVQGPFGRSGSSPLLAATVSNTGGLGSHGVNDLAPEDITKVAAEIRQDTDKPFGMNRWFSTFDQGGDTLEQAAYERVTALFAPRRPRIASRLPAIKADFQRNGFIP